MSSNAERDDHHRKTIMSYALAVIRAECAEAERDAALGREARLREALMVGDRVRINANAGPFCDGYEIGEERYVRGISVDKNLKVDVWLSDHWPPRDGGDDGWEPRMLDKIAALTSTSAPQPDGRESA